MELVDFKTDDRSKSPGVVVGDVYEKINEKCCYGESMEALNEYERAFYVVLVLVAEVDNGGFAQFFDSYSGCFLGEMVSALKRIQAHQISEIYGKALYAFGTELPIDTTERREMLANLYNQEINETLSACDRAFYRCEDELTQCCYEFIRCHQDNFDI